jgi:hypothetical protein
MRTVTFKSVYDQVMRMAGLDPADATFSAARQEFVADCITRRVREGWEYDLWPELMTVEARTPVAGLIAYEQSGQTQLGEVEGVYSANPETAANTARSLGFTMSAAGAQITDTAAPASVYLRFRRRPNRFTRVAWDAGAAYAEGDLVYYASTGECYQAVLDGTDEEWAWMAFPYILESFVVPAAAADYLRDCGQHERADELEARGYKQLEDRHDKTMSQQGMARRVNVRVE